MSDLGFLEKLLDGAAVEWIPLENVAEIKRGTSITKKKVTLGDIPVIAGGRSPAYYHNESNRTGQTIVVAGSGAYAGFVSWWEQSIFVSDAFSVNPKAEVLPRYCFHWLKNLQKQLHELQSGGGVPHVYPRDFAPLRIPIPCPKDPEKSLAIQAEIVRILDCFTALTAELTAELKARKKQFSHYRDHLLSFEDGDVEWKALGNIGEFIRGRRFTKADYVDDGIDVIHYGEIYTRFGLYASQVFSQVGTGMADKLRYAEPGDVILTDVGETVDEVGKAMAWIGDTKVAIHDHCYAFRHQMNPKFVAYCMQSSSFIAKKHKYVAQTKVNTLLIKPFEKAEIPVPYPTDPKKSLAEQARIVAILDKFDTLTTSLSEGLPREIKLRQQQYEYYRDLLLSFPKPDEAA